MQLRPNEGNLISIREEDKFLVTGFKNNRLDSIGGRCTPKDFKRLD